MQKKAIRSNEASKPNQPNEGVRPPTERAEQSSIRSTVPSTAASNERTESTQISKEVMKKIAIIFDTTNTQKSLSEIS